MERSQAEVFAPHFDAMFTIGLVLAEHSDFLTRKRFFAYLVRFCKRLCDVDALFEAHKSSLDQRGGFAQLEIGRAVLALSSWIRSRNWSDVLARESCTSRVKYVLLDAKSSVFQAHPKHKYSHDSYLTKFRLLNRREPSNTAADNIIQLSKYLQRLSKSIYERVRDSKLLPDAFSCLSKTTQPSTQGVQFRDKLEFAKTMFLEWDSSYGNSEFVVQKRDPIERFTIEESSFAEGAYAKLYRARSKNPRVHGQFAVKVIDLASESDLEGVQRLRKKHIEEARLLSKLCKSAFMVRFVEVVETSSRVFLFTSLCSYGSLRCVVQERGKGLVEEDVLGYIVQSVLNALAYMHRQNFYHGDIKGDNILISHTGVVQLCDFGNAHSVLEARDADASSGTPHYMAPEIVNAVLQEKEQPRPVFGFGIDVWALGITTIELVDMDPPMAMAGYMRPLVAAKLSRRSRFDFQSPAKVPDRVKEFVDACLVMKAAARPSASQIIARDFFATTATISPQEFLGKVISS